MFWIYFYYSVQANNMRRLLIRCVCVCVLVHNDVKNVAENEGEEKNRKRDSHVKIHSINWKMITREKSFSFDHYGGITTDEGNHLGRPTSLSSEFCLELVIVDQRQNDDNEEVKCHTGNEPNIYDLFNWAKAPVLWGLSAAGCVQEYLDIGRSSHSLTRLKE